MLPKYEVDNTGAFFVVVIIGNDVVKIPRERKKKTYLPKLEEIATLQNELSEEIQGILPCRQFETHLEMEKAPGIRCDKVFEDKEKRPVLKEKVKEMKDKLKEHGYDPNDTNWRNYFLDGEVLYLVDLHLAKEV